MKDQIVSVRFTAEQWQAIQDAAAFHDQPPSVYIRQHMEQVVRQPLVRWKYGATA